MNVYQYQERNPGSTWAQIFRAVAADHQCDDDECRGIKHGHVKHVWYKHALSADPPQP